MACVVLSGGKRDVLQEFNCFVVNWLLDVFGWHGILLGILFVDWICTGLVTFLYPYTKVLVPLDKHVSLYL